MSESEILKLNRGNIPPQATELEKTALGAAISNSDGPPILIELMKEEYFYLDKHRFIFIAIKNLFRKNDPVDLLTVSEELKRIGKKELAGGDFYLTELTMLITGVANLEFHCRIITQKYISREVIKFGNTLIEDGYDEQKDVFELLAQAYQKLSALDNFVIGSKPVKAGKLLDGIIEKGRRIARGEILPGIPTPIDKLTKKTGGYRDGEFIVIAARPGMGKTSYILNVAKKAYSEGFPVAIFSLEMTNEQLFTRLVSSETGVDGNAFVTDGLQNDDLQKIENKRDVLEAMDIYVDDDDNNTFEKIKLKASSLVKEHGIKLIIIDYLQLMSNKEYKNNREQEISSISRNLKSLAKKLNLPVIALSQLSRSVETRGGSKRPMLSDLRESGSIEQDADMVQFLYRPEYYNIENWDYYGGVSCRGEAEAIVNKNRNGGLCRTRMKWDASTTTFSNLEEAQVVEENKETEDDDIPF